MSAAAQWIVWIGVSVIASGVLADHWGYVPEGANGVVKGNESWGGKCDLGRRQSPVDLTEDASVLGQYPSLMFGNYSEPIQKASVRNTGHSIQIDIDNSLQQYTMTGAGLPGVFIMDQLHFHWASEHTIEQTRYALEMHIVSHEQRFANFAEAVKVKNGVAVLGVLFYVADQHNAVLKNILDSFVPVHDSPGKAHPIKEPLDPLSLLPKHRQRYFRYEGSLTTPSCDEAVIWTVLREPVPLALSQIERFKDTKDVKGEQLTHNYRLVQRLNSRPLVYVMGAPLLVPDDSAALAGASVLLLAIGQLVCAYM